MKPYISSDTKSLISETTSAHYYIKNYITFMQDDVIIETSKAKFELINIPESMRYFAIQSLTNTFFSVNLPSVDRIKNALKNIQIKKIKPWWKFWT